MSYQSYNSLGGWTVRDGEGYEYQDGVNVNPNTTAHRGWFLSFCFALSIWTAIGIGLLVATNLVLSVMTATVTTKEGLYLVVYHIDGIALAAFCLVIELELTETIRSIPIIQNWIFKGFIYIFSALFTLREYSVVSYRWNFIPAVVKFVCLNVIVTAIVYFCMGLLCLKQTKDEKTARYIRLLSQYQVQNSGSLGNMYDTAVIGV